jgi:soluble lytic murein transglycosylase-like protein
MTWGGSLEEEITMKKNARRKGLHLDALTATVASLSIVVVTFLLIAAAGIAWAGTRAGTMRPRVTVAAAPPPTLPPPRLLVRLADLVPAPASVAAAAPVAGLTTAEAAVATLRANPLEEWLSIQPVPLPDWHAIGLAMKDSAPVAASFRPMIRDAAERWSLSPELVEAIARVESDFNPSEVSEKGALGLLQVMPETGKRFGVPRERLFDPEANLAAGTAYLAWLMERYQGDLDLALAAYNAGEGAVDQHGGIPPYRETQQYVKRVKVALRQIAARREPSAVLR